MLAIRMQRTGRTGHTQFRVIVQDSHFSPKSGRVVAYVGSYNPHTKTAIVDKEKISGYLKNGAVPSDRVASLLKKEGVKLPKWYSPPAHKKGSVRNPEKRRSTRPDEPETPAPVAETPAEESTEVKVEEVPTAEEPAPAEEATPAETETPAEETKEAAEEPQPEAEPAPEPAEEAGEEPKPAE